MIQYNEKEVTQTPECLDQLILAHLAAIPFENLEACEELLGTDPQKNAEIGKY